MKKYSFDTHVKLIGCLFNTKVIIKIQVYSSVIKINQIDVIILAIIISSG